MYKNIIERLAAESRKVDVRPLKIKKVVQAAASLNQSPKLKIRNPERFTQNSINENSAPVKTKKNRIPIVKSKNPNVPTKVVDFQDGVAWL